MFVFKCFGRDFVFPAYAGVIYSRAIIVSRDTLKNIISGFVGD